MRRASNKSKKSASKLRMKRTRQRRALSFQIKSETGYSSEGVFVTFR